MNSHSLARTSPFSRELLVRRVRGENWTVAAAAEAFGVSRRTAYKWLARFDEGALRDRSSKPKTSPQQTPAALVEWIVRLRRQRWTGAQIAARLKLPRSTVHRILRRAGLSRLKLLEPPQPVIRYERKHPGELVHIDVKKLGRIGRVGHRIHGDRTTRVRGIGWEFVHVAVDDASRLAYVEVLPDEKGPSCTAFLRRALAWYRQLGIRVRRVMTDNGSAYRWPSGLFGRLLSNSRIKHLKTKAYRPQTNGKAERFIQTMLREWAYAVPYSSSRQRHRALSRWLVHYNRERPHGSLGGRPPISRLNRKSEQRA